MPRGRPGPWSYPRRLQHDARYPTEERALRNRERQATYRERHAADRAKVRAVTNLLSRRVVRDATFVAHLARAIRAAIGDDAARELGEALSASRRRPAARRARR